MKNFFISLMRRMALLLAVGGGLTGTTQAQTPTWDAAWSAGGAGALYAFTTASDAGGNVFVGGRFAGVNVAFGSFSLSNAPTTGTGQGNTNGYLAKYSASGTVLWVQQASVAGFSSVGGITTDAAGNVYATGLYNGGALTLGSITLPAAAGTTNQGFVVKYNAQGTVQWARLLGSSSFSNGYSVAVAPGGSVYVGGAFASGLTVGSLPPLSTTGPADQDPFLLKLDATGSPVWVRQLTGTGGTLQYDYGYAVALDAAGNPALGGYFYSTTLVAGTTTLTNAGTGSTDIFLAKYDAAGNALWAQRAGGTGNDILNGLTATANGNLYLAGTLGAAGGTVAGGSFASSTNSGALLAGYSASGAGLWAVREGNGSSYGSIGTDPGGNLVVAGGMSGTLVINNQTLTSAGSTDILTARYTTAGALIGAGRAGGSGLEYAYGTCATPANGQVVAGYTDSSNLNIGGNLPYTGGTRNALVVSYAASGAVTFARRLSSGGGSDYPTGTAVDAQGNTYVTGTFGNNIRLDGTTSLASSSGSTVFVVKYSPTGTVIWVRQLGTTAAQPANSTYSGGLALDAAGNLYVTGTFSGALGVGSTTLTSTGGASDFDIFLIKYDAQGTVQWARAAGGTDYDEATAVAVNAAGVVAIGGDSYSPSLTFGSQTVPVGANTPSVFVVRYDAAGTAQWAQAFPSGSNDYGYIEAVAVDATGSVGLTGEFSGNLFIGATTLSTTGSYTVFAAKCSAAGVPQWARQAQGNTCFPLRAVFDPAGNFAITGQMQGAATFGSFTLTPPASAGLFLVKYDAAGTVQWARQNSGTASTVGIALTADGAGNFYLGGGYGGGTITLGTITLPASSLYRTLVARYDGQGTPQWAVTVASANTSSSVQSLAIAPAGSLMVTGTYNNFLNLTAALSVQASESVGNDIFVARLTGAVPLATAAPRPALPALALYPNPARGTATVALPAGLAGQPLRLHDALGHELRRFAAPAPGATEALLDLRGLPAGLYLLRIGEATGKLVVE